MEPREGSVPHWCEEILLRGAGEVTSFLTLYHPVTGTSVEHGIYAVRHSVSLQTGEQGRVASTRVTRKANERLWTGIK